LLKQCLMFTFNLSLETEHLGHAHCPFKVKFSLCQKQSKAGKRKEPGAVLW